MVTKIVAETKCPLEIALAWVVNAKNSLHNVYGYSPNQLVFGRKSKHKVVIVKNILQHWIALFRAPNKILSDNGGEFQELQHMSENLNIEIMTMAAESPWSN